MRGEERGGVGGGGGVEGGVGGGGERGEGGGGGEEILVHKTERTDQLKGVQMVLVDLKT